MPDPTLNRLEQKMDDLSSKVGTVSEAITALATRMEAWPDIVKQVNDHERRLTALEQFEVKKYDERIDHLEKTVSGFKGWLAGASAVALATGGIISYLLTHALNL